MELHNRFSVGHGVLVHVGVEKRKAFEHGKLRARTHNRWCRVPGNGIRGERIFFARAIVRDTAERQPRPREFPAIASVRDKHRFMIGPPVAPYRTMGIISCAAGYSNEERIPFTYLFHIVANY